MNDTTSYKFFAFISYRHTDIRIARRLQFLLESYSLPAAIQKTHPGLPKKFTIFRDRDELTAFPLQEALHRQLESSRYLIVICSPESAASKYVGDEIAYFRSLGREKNIIPFIVSGVPYDATRNCFHPELTRDGLELLGIDIQTEDSPFREVRFHKAFVRLVAAMLRLDFGVLWDRRKYFLMKLATALAAVLILLISLSVTVFRAQPFESRIRLQNPVTHLPLSSTHTDSLQLYLSAGDRRSQVIASLDTPIAFPDIPGRYAGQPVRITAQAYGFRPLDTTLVLRPDLTLHMSRLPETFGRLRYRVLDSATEQPLSGVVFDLDFMKASTDTYGILDMTVPLQRQQKVYPVRIIYQERLMHLTYAVGADSLRALPADELPVLYIQE